LFESNFVIRVAEGGHDVSFAAKEI